MATSSSTSSTHSLNMRPGAASGFGELAGYLEARGIRVAGGHSARADRHESQNFRSGTCELTDYGQAGQGLTRTAVAEQLRLSRFTNVVALCPLRLLSSDR
jgi:hypothetical protein